jgi:ribosomal-protein-serine acetyltransferase
MSPFGPPSEIKASEDIVLKKLRPETSPVLFDAINSNRDHLREWLPFVDQTWKVSDTEIFVRSVLGDQGAKKDLIYEIWFRSEFAGLIALKEIDRWNKKTELGYWIIPQFEGKGIITDACRLLIDMAFGTLGMNRIQIKAGVGNARSLRVAERLNFRFEGIERSGEKLNKRYIDLATYSMLRKEWEQD